MAARRPSIGNLLVLLSSGVILIRPPWSFVSYLWKHLRQPIFFLADERVEKREEKKQKVHVAVLEAVIGLRAAFWLIKSTV